MAVRNFWVEANIDGYESTPAGGPRRRDGGMSVTLYQRKDGGIEAAVHLYSKAIGEKLITEVYCGGKLVCAFESVR